MLSHLVVHIALLHYLCSMKDTPQSKLMGKQKWSTENNLPLSKGEMQSEDIYPIAHSRKMLSSDLHAC